MLEIFESFLVETKEKTLVHNTNSLIAIENEEHVNSWWAKVIIREYFFAVWSL